MDTGYHDENYDGLHLVESNLCNEIKTKSSSWDQSRISSSVTFNQKMQTRFFMIVFFCVLQIFFG